MTAKEKSEKLIDSFLIIRNNYNERIDYCQAKKCSLVVVNEILSVIWLSKEDALYWQEVKKELEFLLILSI